MSHLRYIVGVSGGKDSVALALRLQEVEPQTDWEYFITPTGDELPSMVEHWANLERILELHMEKRKLQQKYWSSWFSEYIVEQVFPSPEIQVENTEHA